MSQKIYKTALIFEGGGMRESFSAGVTTVLMDEGLEFQYMAGISAGACSCVNYMSRDRDRVKRTFVDFAADPNLGGWSSFFKGEGYFRSKYIYLESGMKGQALPFQFKEFFQNPADLRIGAFDVESGELVYWQKSDMKKPIDMMKMVCASSSLPLFMPMTKIEDRLYIDGGIGNGIPLDVAIRDGYERFVIVTTRTKDYVKTPVKHERLLKRMFKDYPKVVDAMLQRHTAYNQTREEIARLEAEGKAFVFYPDYMEIGNKERDVIKLQGKYDMGYRQAREALPQLLEFLRKGEADE